MTLVCLACGGAMPERLTIGGRNANGCSAACRKQLNAVTARAWNAKNADKRRASVRRCFTVNGDAYSETAKAWTAKNRDRVRANQLAWKSQPQHKELLSLYSRKAAAKRVVEVINDPVWREIRRAMFDFRSWQCRHPGAFRAAM